jgi:Protein of unknown function (DUF3562)
MTSRPSDTPSHDSTGHARDIALLARETHMPLDDVAQLYARELAALAAGARITSFLPLLTTRTVRAILRQQGHSQRVSPAVETLAPAQTIPHEDHYGGA